MLFFFRTPPQQNKNKVTCHFTNLTDPNLIGDCSFAKSRVVISWKRHFTNCFLKVKNTVIPLSVSVLLYCSPGRGRFIWFNFSSIFRCSMNWDNRCSATRVQSPDCSLQTIPVKDILICLSCQVDVPSYLEIHFSWSFQSPPHSVGGSRDCHNSSWNKQTRGRQTQTVNICWTGEVKFR